MAERIRINTTLSEHHESLLRTTADRQRKTPTTLANDLLSRAIEQHCGAESSTPEATEPLEEERLWRLILLLDTLLEDVPSDAMATLEKSARATARDVLAKAQAARAKS